jgi:hypothetical protein
VCNVIRIVNKRDKRQERIRGSTPLIIFRYVAPHRFVGSAEIPTAISFRHGSAAGAQKEDDRILEFYRNFFAFWAARSFSTTRKSLRYMLRIIVAMATGTNHDQKIALTVPLKAISFMMRTWP